MVSGAATKIYDGVFSGAAINAVINTAAQGKSGEQFVVIPNANNGSVMISHVEGSGSSY